MRYRAVIFAALLLTAAGVSAHPVYVSMCQIHHDAGTDSLEVIVTIFSDDLELAVFEETGVRIFLGTDRQSADADSLVGRYLADRITIAINGDTLPDLPSRFRFDASRARTTCRFAVPQSVPVRRIAVVNRILLDIYDTQRNLVRTRIAGEKLNLVLDAGEPAGVLEYGG